ncbi:LPS export ABC transporter periplasmic protein LptC [bacterium]|nr:LPS export ABC transporter periplasmic protein LptC [bacterium]
MRSVRQKFSQAVIFILLTVLSAVVSVGCSKKSESDVSTISEKRIPVQEGWNSRLYVTREGNRQAVVWYGHMVKYDSTAYVDFDRKIKVDFYNRDGSHVSRLSSAGGRYNEDTEDVMAIGSVIVKSDSGITLYTERLRWDNRKGKIISDTLVMITTPQADTIWGVGFESNADLSRRVITKPWGVGNRRVDLSRVEKEFAKPENADTSAGVLKREQSE